MASAGRGRALVQPAWMTRDEGVGLSAAAKAELSDKAEPAGDRSDSRDNHEDRKRRSADRYEDRRRRSDNREYREERGQYSSSESESESRGTKRKRERSKKRKHKRHKKSSTRRSSSRYPLPLVDSKRTKPSQWDVQTRADTYEPSDHDRSTRHARRLYVGGLEEVNEVELKEFFRSVVAKVLKEGEEEGKEQERVVSAYVNREKRFGFVELDTMELTTACLALDGIDFRGSPLRIRRPNDYQPHLASHSTPPALDLSSVTIHPPTSFPSSSSSSISPGFSNGGDRMVSPLITDGPNKLFVGGLPHHLTDAQIVELLEAFGKLKALKVIKAQNVSKGYCFCEYENPDDTDTAIQGLNGLAIGDRTLTVRRSDPNFQQNKVPGLLHSPSHQSQVGPEAIKPPTNVLVLFNMVTEEELVDDAEYEEIVLDVKEECQKFGTVKRVEIPRPGSNSGVGKVFVEFESSSEALKARLKLEGRSFARRTVKCDFLEADKFARNEFD